MKHHSAYLSLLAMIAIAAITAACDQQTPASFVTILSTHAAQPYASATATPAPIAIALGGSMGTAYWPDGDSPAGGQGQTGDGIGCDRHMSSLIHIHLHLDICDATGRELQLPWAVGIVAPWGYKNYPAGPYVATGHCYYDLHTHDRDGVIHYEATDHTGLTLGNFFDVWGQPLSMTNVAGLTGTVWVMYGTKQPRHLTWSNTVDPRTIPLIEHEYVELAIDNPPKPSSLPDYRWTY